MKGTQVTIKDIARQLGISVATVSRALRDLPDIHPDTKKSVLDLAREWDYQPNQVALSLVKSRTKTIGIIVPNVGYHFFSTAISGIEEEALTAGYSVLVTQSRESYLRELTNIQDLSRGQVDGFIISVSRETRDYDHFRKLQRKGFPLVFFDRDIEELEVSKVVINNRLAAKQAVLHLGEQKCSRIAILAGPAYLSLTHQRLLGYKDALLELGHSIDERLIVYGDYSHDNAVELTHYLMNLPQPPDGIFAVSDRLAVGATVALKKRKVRIPKDVALIGFNNEPIASLLTPTLSSVVQPIDEIGRTAARLLLNQLNYKEKEPFKPEVKVLETHLVIRESSNRALHPVY
ncbi:MAG: LacI family DNA-binding transcriptional regulator [Spirosomataceae bacterium]